MELTMDNGQLTMLNAEYLISTAIVVQFLLSILVCIVNCPLSIVNCKFPVSILPNNYDH